MREVINGIHYVPRSGCAWHLMPHDLPHWQTAYHSFRAWRQGGTWLRLHDRLRQEVRTRMGRHPQPSAASIDAQTVKTTEHVLQPVERKNGAVGVRLQQAAETYSCGLLAAFPLNGLRSRVLPQYGEWLTDALSALRAPFFKGEVHGNRIAFLEPPRGGWWEADAWGNCRPFQFESTSGGRYQSESTGDAFRAEYVPGDGLVSWPTPLGVTPAVCRRRRLPFQPRLFRIVRLVSVLSVARVARGLRLVRVLSGLNRGMRARGATLRRRGFGYVLALTVVVTLVGAAGMCAFESDPRGGRGPHDYGTALWWTAMVMTTISTGLRRTPLTYPAFFRPTGRLP